MSDYHCLNCGEKLKQLSSHEWADKYKCPNCGTEWFRIKRLMIEYVGFVDFSDASFIIKTSYMSSYTWMDYEINVLGNIYEDPELLEGEKC